MEEMRIGDMPYNVREKAGKKIEDGVVAFLKSKHYKVRRPKPSIFKEGNYIKNHTPDIYVVGKSIIDVKMGRNLRIDLLDAYQQWYVEYLGNSWEIPMYIACYFKDMEGVALYSFNALYTADKTEWRKGEWSDGNKYYTIPKDFPRVGWISLK